VEDDVVTITRRKRGAPLDKIVAELMIFANSTWGKLMADHGVPGIYRAQGGGSGAWAAKMQVRMITHAAPHQGLGVDQYAWSTSPLRRYTDLVNQWQILACIEHGVTAPLVAPFKPRDADLFAIVSGFDAAYAGYADFQNTMERYWCLRWLAQEQAKLVEAVVLKDEIVRLTELPLVIRLPGMPQVARGLQVKLDLVRWDEVDLSIEARLLDIPAAQPAGMPGDAGDLDVLDDEYAEEAAIVAGETAHEIDEAIDDVTGAVAEDVAEDVEADAILQKQDGDHAAATDSSKNL
jgi:exoribonuclease-2